MSHPMDMPTPAQALLLRQMLNIETVRDVAPREERILAALRARLWVEARWNGYVLSLLGQEALVRYERREAARAERAARSLREAGQ